MAILNNNEALNAAKAFLMEQKLMTLSTVHQNNQPHSATLLFTIDAELNFYFLSHKTSLKTDNINQNSSVAGSVFELGSWYVQFHGTTEQVQGKLFDSAIDKIINQADKLKDFWPPLFMKIDPEYVVYKITPTWLRLTDLSTSTITSNPMPVYTLIGSDAK